MDLKTMHIKLIPEPIDLEDYLTIDDWDSRCNVQLEHYSNFIRTIDDVEFNKNICIVESEEILDKLRKYRTFQSDDLLQVFIGNFDEIKNNIVEKFIVSQKLDNLERVCYDSEVLSKDNAPLHYTTISFGEPIKIQGFYYHDRGCQRNAMNSDFIEAFSAYDYFGKKEDFEFAFSCLDIDFWEDIYGMDEAKEFQNKFKNDFIDKFEFGKSLLWPLF